MSEIEWRGEFEELEASLVAMRAERDTLAAQVQALTAHVERLKVGQATAVRALEAASADVTDWILIADGIKHDPRCANHFMGDVRLGPCWRCREEAAEARIVSLEGTLRELQEQARYALGQQTRPAKLSPGAARYVLSIVEAALQPPAGRAPEEPTTAVAWTVPATSSRTMASGDYLNQFRPGAFIEGGPANDLPSRTKDDPTPDDDDGSPGYGHGV